MRIVIGDVIGTTDGRYGTITAINGNVVEVTESVHPDDDHGHDNVFEVTTDQVASVR